MEIGSGDVILSVTASPLDYEFFYQPTKGPAKKLGTALTCDLSSEKAGGFTGVFMGLYATGNGQKSTRPADFDWFEYRPAENNSPVNSKPNERFVAVFAAGIAARLPAATCGRTSGPA